MIKKTNTWLLTLSVAAVVGAVSLYSKVKKAAIRHLNKGGAFDDIREERSDAIREITGEPERKAEKRTAELTVEDEDPSKSPKWADNVVHSKIDAVNQQYRKKKSEIIQSEGVDHFTGAWNKLSNDEKTTALTFSAVNSIVAGGLTYALTHVSRRAGKSGKRQKSDGSSCGGVSGCGSSTHHHTSHHDGGHGGHGGHGCGHGCGGGCGGGCGA